MDEYTYKGYLAEKQAFEARIAELEAALEERRTEVVAWRSKVAALGLELSETKALLAMANAHNASLEESRRIARECIRCANDYIKELKAEVAELRGRIGG